jgi:hypothetical protein
MIFGSIQDLQLKTANEYVLKLFKIKLTTFNNYFQSIYFE